MTTAQFRDVEEIKRIIGQRITAKYARGQTEHGGNLWERPALPSLVDEVTDLNTYLVTLERQLQDLRSKLTDARNVLAEGDAKGAAAMLEQLDNLLACQLRPDQPEVTSYRSDQEAHPQ